MAGLQGTPGGADARRIPDKHLLGGAGCQSAEEIYATLHHHALSLPYRRRRRGGLPPPRPLSELFCGLFGRPLLHGGPVCQDGRTALDVRERESGSPERKRKAHRVTQQLQMTARGRARSRDATRRDLIHTVLWDCARNRIT